MTATFNLPINQRTGKANKAAIVRHVLQTRPGTTFEVMRACTDLLKQYPTDARLGVKFTSVDISQGKNSLNGKHTPVPLEISSPDLAPTESVTRFGRDEYLAAAQLLSRCGGDLQRATTVLTIIDEARSFRGENP